MLQQIGKGVSLWLSLAGGPRKMVRQCSCSCDGPWSTSHVSENRHLILSRCTQTGPNFWISPVFCATGCLVPVVQAHLLVLAWHHFSRSTSGFFELRSIPVLRTILVTHESSLHSATAICYLSKCWLGNKASFWSETGPKKMQVTFRWSYWVRSVSQCSWEDQG